MTVPEPILMAAKMTEKQENVSRNLEKTLQIARLRSFALPHGFPRPRGEVLPQRILGIKKGYSYGYIYPTSLMFLLIIS